MRVRTTFIALMVFAGAAVICTGVQPALSQTSKNQAVQKDSGQKPAAQPLAAQGPAVPSPAAQTDDPTSKLKAFLGKWDSQAVFASGMKATAKLDCVWSPQGRFLVCEQHVKLQDGEQKREQRQLTIYSYNAKENVYRYSTISDPGMPPSTGIVDIKGNVWVYDSSFENNGKTIKIHNTNTFTDARNEVFKIVTSDDGGATWKPLLDGSARKVGD
jgi:hypothetical protein